MKTNTDRLIVLEGMRGMAALMVVVFHSILAFHPAFIGRYIDDPSVSVIGTIWFAFINGTAAVAFFFTLSGFVLVYRAIDSGDIASINPNLIRRWPRLALPVIVVTMASWFLFYVDAYSYVKAGEISGSQWLFNFGGSSSVPIGTPLSSAALEGVFYTFFRGDHNYVTALWTMHYEFTGSFIVFGLAYFIVSVRSNKILSLYAIGIVSLLVMYISPWYLCFTLGIVVALYQNSFRVSAIYQYFAVAIGIYLFGYNKSVGLYALFGNADTVIIYAVASTLLLCTFLHVRLTGILAKAFAILGELSFPIYLVHMLVLTSVGSWVYVWLSEIGGNRVIWACAISVFLSIIASIPLVYLNRVWLRFMKDMEKNLVKAEITRRS